MQRGHRIDDHRGHDQPREPLVIGGHHEPRRVAGGGVADHLLVGPHVLVPVRAFAHVTRSKLPVLLRLVEPLEKSLSLLLARHVQEELADDSPVAGQVALEVADVLEALVPDPRRHELRRELLRVEQLIVHAYDEHLLVVGTVEDPDAAALRQRAEASPHVVMVELLLRGRLERGHVAALRVDTREDVLDRAVLPRRIHRLEDQEQRPPILRVELVLQVRELLDAFLQIVLRAVLVVLREPERVVRVDPREREASAARDAIG